MIKEKNNDGFIANNLGFDLNYYYRIKGSYYKHGLCIKYRSI